MRKSGPFRSIRLCAYTAVGADAGVSRIVIAPDDISVEIAEAAGWLASLVDRRCLTTKPSNRTQTNMRTARRPRIRSHLMGAVPSRRIHRLRDVLLDQGGPHEILFAINTFENSTYTPTSTAKQKAESRPMLSTKLLPKSRRPRGGN